MPNTRTMIRNYLLIAWRAASRDKVYALLNIIGLTAGISSALAIFLYVSDELLYDSHHQRSDRIYRLNAAYHLPKNGGFEEYAASGPAIADVIANDFPELEQVVRFRRLHDVVIERPGEVERFYETLVAADSNVFEVFTFPFVSGDPANALQEARTVVISERLAQKYFNRTDVVGESLHLPEDSVDLKITGVFKDYPSNTHLKFDMLTSLETYRTMTGANLRTWWSYSFYTYLLVKSNTDASALESKIRFISRKYIPDQEDYSGYKQEYSLIPFSDIHMHSNLRSEIEPNSKAAYVYIFLVIGIFILVIASINFMNLATARSARRAREIGLRKVVGALRGQLMGQFLCESFLTTIISVALAVIICVALLPVLNDFTGKSLAIFSNYVFWLVLLAVVIFVGLLAGMYPAIFLSAFKPVETLKGNFKNSAKGNILRKVLVVFQFSISIFLIAGTLIIFNHLEYIRSINLGFDKEKIIYIPTHGIANAARDFLRLKNELERLSGIESATLSHKVPGMEMDNIVVRMGWDDDAAWSDMRFITVDPDFIDTYGLTLIEGRSFSKDRPSDENSAFILNESGMQRLGWNDPKAAIGKPLRWMNRNGEVIGVVKDFHFMSANMAIEPFIMVMNSSWSVMYLSAKLSTGHPGSTIQQIENLFHEILPGKIFQYHFLDKDFDQQYQAEEKFMKVFTFFSAIAILIAALGLYGLAMFMTELKVRELGIRKVLGATEGGLVFLLTKDFMALVLIAMVFAFPGAWWIMDNWLNSFPLREPISFQLLVVAGLIALAIAMITVSYQSIKAARANPIKSISTN